jgi:allantoate deiminase
MVDGRSGHAGTTPMDLRRDALAGAAACVLLVERMARSVPGLVGTVGDLRVRNGAGNVIAGHVEFSVDIRYEENDIRTRFCRDVFAEIERELGTRDLGCQVFFPMVQSAVQGSPRLTDLLSRAVEQYQAGACPRMVSGAGHDVAAVAAVAETALLFVRCRGGLSHHPDEYATPGDVAVARSVLIEVLEKLVFQ